MRLLIFFCTTVVFILAFVSFVHSDDSKDDLKQMQGYWNVVALEADGRKAPDDAVKGMHVRIKGTEFEGIDPGEASGDKATIKLDSSKSPKQIDLVALTGKDKGKTIEGIYKLEKDRLMICMRGPEAAEKGRPKEFSSGDAGSGLGIMTLERVKE
ncbi:MAG TPA: TIGR03067 domain-containing protein [Gemmataceae bacterium]|nr:TIGR03067 domain-containing protein [Gemmataceae bacterium]